MTDNQQERLVVAFESIADSLAAVAAAGGLAPANITPISGKEETSKDDKPAKAEKPAKQEKSEKPAKEEKEKPTEDTETKIDLTALTTLARKLVRSEKKPQIIELLDERGIAKISATPKTDWDEVYEALKEIDDL